jgi:hypothetical protein
VKKNFREIILHDTKISDYLSINLSIRILCLLDLILYTVQWSISKSGIGLRGEIVGKTLIMTPRWILLFAKHDSYHFYAAPAKILPIAGVTGGHMTTFPKFS